MSAPFYYTPEILRYDFGPSHPLRPERLRRTVELVQRYGIAPSSPPEIEPEDLRRIHTDDYIQAVKEPNPELSAEFGFYGDNPPFPGMYQSAAAYVAATAQAAKDVKDGCPLAFGIGGGLHHALPARASGFCIFNDCAIAAHILGERFARVAYIDIDVHHGDGVQWTFYEDPTVLTVSIHESPKSLWPGTGGTEEMGEGGSALNLPIAARTSGDAWLAAFRRIVPRAIERFRAEAIVLQMGTDTHFSDPLAHLQSTQQHWLEAVETVKDFGLPIVALGGGGYALEAVPRMWASAVLTLSGIPYEDALPEDLGREWGTPSFSDPDPVPLGLGFPAVEAMCAELEAVHPLLIDSP